MIESSDWNNCLQRSFVERSLLLFYHHQSKICVFLFLGWTLDFKSRPTVQRFSLMFPAVTVCNLKPADELKEAAAGPNRPTDLWELPIIFHSIFPPQSFSLQTVISYRHPALKLSTRRELQSHSVIHPSLFISRRQTVPLCLRTICLIPSECRFDWQLTKQTRTSDCDRIAEPHAERRW